MDQNAEKKKKTPTKSKEFVEESEEETDYEPTDSESSASGTESEAEEEMIIEKKKAASQKRKRKEKDTKEKKGKKAKIEDQPLNEGEIKFEPEKNEKKGKSKMGPALPNFESGKVDKNLFSEDPNNIIAKTILINTGLKLSCKMISGVAISSNKTQYPDWAALVFQKKIKDNKVFEFNVNLKEAPKIIEAIKYIMAENQTFFNNV